MCKSETNNSLKLSLARVKLLRISVSNQAICRVLSGLTLLAGISMLLKEFALEVDLPSFYKVFWLDSDWYANFLTEQLQDLNVEVGNWEDKYHPIRTENSQDVAKKSRVVRSFHPSKVSFPGLPSHAEVKLNVLSLMS